MSPEPAPATPDAGTSILLPIHIEALRGRLFRPAAAPLPKGTRRIASLRSARGVFSRSKQMPDDHLSPGIISRVYTKKRVLCLAAEQKP